MLSVEAHRDAFMSLLRSEDNTGCIKYIDEHDDFYNMKFEEYGTNMLQWTCIYKRDKVAIALIDKKCDLTYKNGFNQTALSYALLHGQRNIAAHIIDNLQDTATRNITMHGHYVSELMMLCNYDDTNNVIKMIDKGHDIYYETDSDKLYYKSLFTIALVMHNEVIAKKLIDIDTDFIIKFKYYNNVLTISQKMRNKIMKYCADKYDAYKHKIIDTMNSASPTNALYQSFHTTYAVQLVDIICDFILLRI
ncbi:MAG: hypothetical protein Faunusvirus55_4 [Faunusvirus sp.]|jgi:hypothetical protein|uniref:Uncharacterized protein n=1 Tax=Faunusvirus sp. TaxID=2487766 RepID=A0A3G4ZY16_9VIRU|nr:MAG: hypothetical protein Faunusvirus55_4 [Faunusvirus sp.]